MGMRCDHLGPDDVETAARRYYETRTDGLPVSRWEQMPAETRATYTAALVAALRTLPDQTVLSP